MKRLYGLVLCVLLLSGCCPGAFAGSVQPIEAHVSPGISIVHNNRTLSLQHNGKLLAPILFEGLTYVPLQQMMAALGEDVSFDQASNTFYVGAIPGGLDFIGEMEPYATDRTPVRSVGEERTIAGKTYARWLEFSYDSKLYYNLEGKYKTLTFKIYSEYEEVMQFLGDNGAILLEVKTVPKQLPKTYTVDVGNVVQFEIVKVLKDSVLSNMFIFDAVIR